MCVCERLSVLCALTSDLEHSLLFFFSNTEVPSRSGFRLFSSSDPEWDSQLITTQSRPCKNTNLSYSSSDRLYNVGCCSDRLYIVSCSSHSLCVVVVIVTGHCGTF